MPLLDGTVTAAELCTLADQYGTAAKEHSWMGLAAKHLVVINEVVIIVHDVVVGDLQDTSWSEHP